MQKKTRFLSAQLARAALVVIVSGGTCFAQGIPSPETVVGHEIGADYKLVTYEQAVQYFEKLDQASPLLGVFDMGETRVISKYPGGDLLMSGYLKGGEHLNGKAAAVDVTVGEGRVILLGFGVKQRAQPHGTFKLLFNSIFYGVIP